MSMAMGNMGWLEAPGTCLSKIALALSSAMSSRTVEFALYAITVLLN
jgi:hypothetical protein